MASEKNNLVCAAMMRLFAAGIVVCMGMLCSQLAGGQRIVATAAARGVGEAPCPAGAIAVEPGASIQAAVDLGGEGAAFCLKKGVHRMQVIRPKSGQSFYGEG